MAKNKDGFEPGQEVSFEQIVAAEAARKRRAREAAKPKPKRETDG